MVLYQHDHPIHWSPAYIGGKVKYSHVDVSSKPIITDDNKLDVVFYFRVADMAGKIADN